MLHAARTRKHPLLYWSGSGGACRKSNGKQVCGIVAPVMSAKRRDHIRSADIPHNEFL